MPRRMMRRWTTLVAVLGTLVLLLAPTSPAAAEIDGPATTYWGVDGLATGTQTDSIEANVFAIEQIGNRIYVGGRFLDVAHEANRYSQPFLAAYDAGSGVWIDTFLPALDGAVYALEASPDGERLFVGGDFTTANGVSTRGLVALDPITGAVDTSWTGQVTGAPFVRALDTHGGWLYVGGSFNGIASGAGNNQAWNAARFDLATSAHDASWRPVVGGGAVWGIAASPDADRVYFAGYFTTVNGSTVSGGFAATEASSSALAAGVEPLQVNTAKVDRQYSYDVEVTQGKVWVAGSEHSVQVLDEADLSLLRFHRSSAKGDYQDLEVVGDRVYAGCHCRADSIIESADGVLWFGTPPAGEGDAPIDHVAPNTWVTAFDAVSGNHVDTFRPPITATSAGVWAVHGSPSGGCLWLGGDLTSVSGSPVNAMVRLCDPALADTQRPSVPGAPTFDIGADSVTATWTASTDDVGVSGYQVFDADTDTLLVETAATTVTFDGLTPDTYRYYVKAYDAAGNTSWRSGTRAAVVTGNADTERPSTPGKPQVVDQGADWVTLDWNASTDDVGVTGYHVYDSATDEIVATTLTNTATFSQMPPASYGYYVKAFDAADNESWRSGITTVVITGDADLERPSTPGKPTVADQGADFVTLDWLPSTDNVAVTGYELYDADTDQVVATVATPPTTVNGLTPGTYRYYVKAFDEAGNTSWRSGITTVTITGNADTERPSTPTGLMGTSPAPGTVDLVWNASTDNVGVAGYTVFDAATNSPLADVAASSATIGNLPAGTASFYVKAFDAAGNTSWRSNVVSVAVG